MARSALDRWVQARADRLSDRLDGAGVDKKMVCRSAKCGRRFTGEAKSCPICGGMATSLSSMRMLGALLLLCGLFLGPVCAYYGYQFAPSLLDPGVDYNGNRFDGSEVEGMIGLGLMGVLTAFGLVAIISGLHVMRHGYVSYTLWLIAMPFVVILLGVAFVADLFL